MAVEYCSENSALVMSPRISFSYDLSQSDPIPIEQTLFRSNSKSDVDFNFCIGETQENYPYSAEEFFSDGKIIPTQIKKNITRKKQSSFEKKQSISPKQSNLSKPSEKKPETETDQREINEGMKEKQNFKSFWGFKRSNSLNCGSGYATSLCSLPLMSRSNSTGSDNNNCKKASILKENQSTQRQNFLKNASRSSNLKPPMKKNYGNGVNPALNVHSGNLFGLGSIFSNGKDKNKKKLMGC